MQEHAVPSELEIISTRWVVKYAHGMKGDRVGMSDNIPLCSSVVVVGSSHITPAHSPPHSPLRHLPPCAEPQLLVVGRERGGDRFDEGAASSSLGAAGICGFRVRWGRLKKGVR